MNDNTGYEATDSAPTSEDESALSLDTVFEVLANRRRRFALYALTDASNGVVALDTLFEDVATLIAALDDDPVTRDRYLDIAADLYHWHLPVLDDVGLVECDTRSQTVRYLCDPTLETWLDRVKRDELG